MPLSRQGVVTPEAVLLQFRPAGLGSRMASYVLDVLIWGTVYVLMAVAGAIIFSSTSVLPGWVGITALTLFTFGVFIFYPVLFEWLWNGRTPGKAVFGLRVVTIEGSPLAFRHAMVRAAVGLFEIIATSGFAASVAIFLGSGGRRIGDHAAGTVVLRERSAQSFPSAITFHAPEGAEEYTSTLDVSMLSQAEYVTIRSFLVRSKTLDDGARAQLANQVGQLIRARVRTRPPDWLTAEGFLLCVAAAYQRRFAGQ